MRLTKQIASWVAARFGFYLVPLVLYVCPQCELQAWAKTGVSINCGGCQVSLEEEKPEEDEEDLA